MKHLLPIILLLSGCGTFSAIDSTQRLTNATVVTWETVDDVDKVCREKTGGNWLTYLGTYSGCSNVTAKRCHIITGKDTSMPILGHELRHCFEGNFHK